MSMRVEPLTSHMGAVVYGLDLSRPLSEADRTEVLALFQDKHLLVFKDRVLSPEQQVQFSAVFGELETFPYTETQIKGRPEIFRLSNVQGKGHENVGFYWHQDGSFREMPTAATLFHMIQVPQQGGATLFTNMNAAYEALSNDIKTRIEGVKTVHGNGVVHSLVFTHPTRQRKSLYFNVGLTAGLIGFEANEEQAMFKLLRQHLDQEKNGFTPTPGAKVIW